ncbi:MAG TPA: HTTM domain-containing protein [Acidimicrobiales bacterium]|nr:HTTM domain-containing protein [Acidimicrobiales bacterium]
MTAGILATSRSGVNRALEAWDRFWFRPGSTATLAVFRIAYGLVILAWAISLRPDLNDFFSPDGILAEQPDRAWDVGLFQLADSQTAMIGLYLAFLAGAVCLTVGYRTRLAAVVTFVALISFQRRNPYIDNAGDGLLRILGLYLMLTPAGVALSVDRWRKHREAFWEFPERALWGLRLVQIQLSVIYLATVWDKARGETWSNGTAVAYALRNGTTQRLRVPEAVTDNLFIMNLATWGTLAVELALVFLVWNRVLRPWVLGLGVALHLSIDVVMSLGFFSIAMYVLYIAFVPPEVMERWVLRARQRWRRGATEPPSPAEEKRPTKRVEPETTVART